MRHFIYLLFSLCGCSLLAFAVEDNTEVSSKNNRKEELQEKNKKPVHFQDPAVASNTASASDQADFAPAVFPNYFGFIPENEALALMNKSIASVLSRLQIPYIDPAQPTNADGSPRIKKDVFFITLEGIIKRVDPGAKVYISGGVVRSILGYVYKKLYHEHQRALVEAVNMSDVDMKALVQNTFDRIIDGRSRKEEPIMLHDSYSQLPAKDIDMLTALGIGNDLDILVKFSNNFTGNKKAIMDEATDFINSAEHALGLRDDTSSLKKSIVPIGDVKDYDTQVGTDRSGKNAVTQGGSSLDWLAFPVSVASGNTMLMPTDYQEIMKHFMKGQLDYIQSPTTPTPDKQTIRGLRALLELPFLNYTANGFEIIKAELEALIAKGSISFLAQEQIGKMIRNARFEGAKNRFSSSIPGLSADSIEGLVHQMAAKHSSAKIPEFMVKNDPALRHGIDKGGFAKAGILMPVDAFIKNHTDNGILYHGTPDFTNVLNMIRNGMMLSIDKKQGIAAYGRGVYTDQTRSTAESYTQNTGVVLELKVQEKGLRVLDWQTARKNLEIISLFDIKGALSNEKVDMIFEKLASDYDIDIIITRFPLIQNAAAITLPKKSRDILKLQIQHVENNLNAHMQNELKPAIEAREIIQCFNYLHPKGKCVKFSSLLGIAISENTKQQATALLLRYLQQRNASSLRYEHDVADAVYSMILSRGKKDWNTQEDKEIYATALKVYKKYIEDCNKNKSVSDELVASIIALKNAGITVFPGDLENLIPVLDKVTNINKIIETIQELQKEAGLQILSKDIQDVITLLESGAITPEIKQTLKSLKEKTGIAISVDNLQTFIPVLDQVTDIGKIIETIQELQEKTGIAISGDGLTWIVSVLDQVTDIDYIIEKIQSLKEKTGIAISGNQLTWIIPVLGKVTDIDYIIETIRDLKKEGCISSDFISNDLNPLKRLFLLLDKVQNKKKVTKNISKLREAGVEIIDHALARLVPVLDKVTNINEVASRIARLLKAGISISNGNLNDLIPVLDKVTNIDEIIEKLNTLPPAEKDTLLNKKNGLTNFLVQHSQESATKERADGVTEGDTVASVK